MNDERNTHQRNQTLSLFYYFMDPVIHSYMLQIKYWSLNLIKTKPFFIYNVNKVNQTPCFAALSIVCLFAVAAVLMLLAFYHGVLQGRMQLTNGPFDLFIISHAIVIAG